MRGPPSFIYDDNHLPPLATYPPTLDEQPLIVGIHGLATHETHSRVYCYPRGGLLPRLLTLTLTGGHSLLRYYALTNIKPLTCAVLYVARTFLPHLAVAAMERVCAAKIQNIIYAATHYSNINLPKGIFGPTGYSSIASVYRHTTSRRVLLESNYKYSCFA